MTSRADARVAGLYALPLDRFTAERNALAAELRSEGNAEAAAAVKALRKPTATAAAVNRLVRAEPELVEALLGAGGELRQAHRQAASGHGAAQLRAAAEAERAAIEQLMARVPEVLGRPPGAALGEAIRNTLHAASSDDTARDLVATGTLTTELRPVGLGPVPQGPPKPRASAAAERQAAAKAAKQLKDALSTEAALRREVAAATRASERAEESHARAQEAAETAAERAREARKRLRDARALLADAERARARLQRDA